MSAPTNPGEPSAVAIHAAAADALPPRTLYGLLQLRSEVFVVEQDCVYQDLDGRDLEPGALQLWQEEDGRILATLRILDAPGGRAIGRVVTAPAARGRGLAGQLIAAALERCGGQPVRISAQAHLQAWYERFGFVREGDEYLEDGIPHVAMRRPPDDRAVTDKPQPAR